MLIHQLSLNPCNPCLITLRVANHIQMKRKPFKLYILLHGQNVHLGCTTCLHPRLYNLFHLLLRSLCINGALCNHIYSLWAASALGRSLQHLQTVPWQQAYSLWDARDLSTFWSHHGDLWRCLTLSLSLPVSPALSRAGNLTSFKYL